MNSPDAPPDRPAKPRRPKKLQVILLYGPTGSGKSFLTERVLAIEYDVMTHKLDSTYRQALEAAEIPKQGRQWSVYKEAGRLREGAYDPETVERFWEEWDQIIRSRLEDAHRLRVAIAIEGYTAKLPDEAARIRALAKEVSTGGCGVARILVKPTIADWNEHLAVKRKGMGRPERPRYDEAEYARQMAQAEPVPGVVDHVVADPKQFRKLAKDLRLKRHRWYQAVSLGPVTTTGSVDAVEKVDTVEDRDVVGRRMLDVCCATGVHAIMFKDRGAKQVVGIERDSVRYTKALELRKTLIRHSDLDAKVTIRHGDALELLPTLGAFDTTVLFGAMHYFPDYEEMLRKLAEASRRAAYIEFSFAEGEHDTADHPGTLREYVRSRTGTAIYMADADTLEEILARAMPGFEITARTPTSHPKHSRREIWQLRRD